MGDRLTDAELEEAFAQAHGSLRLTAALSELRDRRAADLDATERVEAERFVAWAVDDLEVAEDPAWAPLFAGARAVRKLLGGRDG